MEGSHATGNIQCDRCGESKLPDQFINLRNPGLLTKRCLQCRQGENATVSQKKICLFTVLLLTLSGKQRQTSFRLCARCGGQQARCVPSSHASSQIASHLKSSVSPSSRFLGVDHDKSLQLATVQKWRGNIQRENRLARRQGEEPNPTPTLSTLQRQLLPVQASHNSNVTGSPSGLRPSLALRSSPHVRSETQRIAGNGKHHHLN